MPHISLFTILKLCNLSIYCRAVIRFLYWACLFTIYKINTHISISYKDARYLRGCDSVTSEENWCAKLGVLLMTQWILCPACVCLQEITIDKRGGNVWGWLFSQYDSFSIILLFSMYSNLFAFWCIFRPLALPYSHKTNLSIWCTRCEYQLYYIKKRLISLNMPSNKT